MDFQSFITEFEKVGKLHKQGQDQSKAIQSLLDDVYKDFFLSALNKLNKYAIL